MPQVANYKLQFSKRLHFTGNPRQTNRFPGNSLHDMDWTAAAGEECMYHDQLADIYTRYHVWSSYISVQLINADENGAIVTLFPNGDAVAPTTYDQAAEQHKAKTIVIGSDNAADIQSLYHRAKTADILNHLGKKDDQTNSVFGNNPEYTWLWHLYAENITGAAALDLWILVHIVQNVTVYNTDTLATS